MIRRLSDEFEVVRLHESAKNNIKYKKAGNTMVRFKESYNGGYDYITSELVEMSGNKLLANAYDRNELSVVVHDNVFWLEQTPSRRVGEIAIKEVKRLFPELIYLGDIHIEGKRRMRSGSRLKESAHNEQLYYLGELFDMLVDTNTDSLQGYMNEVLDKLSSLYVNMYKKGEASQAERFDFYDRVKPILESLEYALEDAISECNRILTDKKYRDYIR